jgi:glycolate oxidase
MRDLKKVIEENSVVALFEEISGKDHVITQNREFYDYGKDETLDLHFDFDILIRPASVPEISSIVKICSKYRIPITPRGGGSGVTGGALPVRGGVVLSTERLNKILEINKIENYVISECGVVTDDLRSFAEANDLFLPVYPSSSSYSFTGGNVAENAGSINSCKFGSTSQYILNLEVVMPNGDVIWTGANVSKNVSGLNITQLFVGSEGILGIITKIVYRLITKPKYEVMLLAGFSLLESACKAVIAIKQSRIKPAAVELMCSNAIDLTRGYLGEEMLLKSKDITTHLLISVQEDGEPALHNSLEELNRIIGQYTDENILVAESSSEKYRVTKVRFNIGNAMTMDGRKYRDIDACVPLSFLYDYIKKAEAIAASNRIKMVCFGHALDGNLHTMLVFDDEQSVREKKAEKAILEIYKYVVSIGGVISGEHGIGMLQRDYMKIQHSGSHMKLLRKIKRLIDPNNIMNPGKLV